MSRRNQPNVTIAKNVHENVNVFKVVGISLSSMRSLMLLLRRILGRYLPNIYTNTWTLPFLIRNILMSIHVFLSTNKVYKNTRAQKAKMLRKSEENHEAQVSSFFSQHVLRQFSAKNHSIQPCFSQFMQLKVKKILLNNNFWDNLSALRLRQKSGFLKTCRMTTFWLRTLSSVNWPS